MNNIVWAIAVGNRLYTEDPKGVLLEELNRWSVSTRTNSVQLLAPSGHQFTAGPSLSEWFYLIVVQGSFLLKRFCLGEWSQQR